jgi:hypothetical protein
MDRQRISYAALEKTRASPDYWAKKDATPSQKKTVAQR